MTTRITTPILDESLMTAIENAVIMFEKRAEWKKLGMDKLREQGAAILFHGPPGTGKTITARWLAKKLTMPIHEMDFSMIGSDTPGELGRNIKKLFYSAVQLNAQGQMSMVFLDECDTMLVSRARLGHTSLWMLEPINALLREIGTYPGLIVLSTNQVPEFLDFALQRRLIGQFEFGVPSFLTRVKMWKAKIPPKILALISISDGAIETLAEFPLTGAEIENAIISWVSDCLRTEKGFAIKDLYETLDKHMIVSRMPKRQDDLAQLTLAQ